MTNIKSKNNSVNAYSKPLRSRKTSLVKNRCSSNRSRLPVMFLASTRDLRIRQRPAWRPPTSPNHQTAKQDSQRTQPVTSRPLKVWSTVQRKRSRIGLWIQQMLVLIREKDCQSTRRFRIWLKQSLYLVDSCSLRMLWRAARRLLHSQCWSEIETQLHSLISILASLLTNKMTFNKSWRPNSMAMLNLNVFATMKDIWQLLSRDHLKYSKSMRVMKT